ncbi:MAG: hypothetical protein ACYTAS_20095, partial [Planctomycetota bacterium]
MLLKIDLKAWAAIAAVLTVVALPNQARAQDFILHPGYIEGTVTIPDGLGGNHTIDRLHVSARGQDAEGNWYQASTQPYGDQFSLVVEGGDWVYKISVTAGYDSSDNNWVRWTRHSVVGVDETVIMSFATDAVVTGTVLIDDAPVIYMRPIAYSQETDVGSPAYEFVSIGEFNDGDYRLPVVGGDAAYKVAPGSIEHTSEDNFMYLASEEATVAAGQEAVVDFTVLPGYIEGTVTLEGASFLPEAGHVGARLYDPSRDTWVYASTRLSPDGTYRLITHPGYDLNLYGTVKTTQGDHSLIDKTVDVMPYDTELVDWEVILDVWIGGEIVVTGLNLSKIKIYGFGPPGASRSETIFSPGQHYDYSWDSMAPGPWGIRTELWTEEMGADNIQRIDHYAFPFEWRDVEPGGQMTVDFSLDPGFVAGTLLDENSAAIPYLWRTRVAATPVDGLAGEWAETTQYDYNPDDEFGINSYDLFVAPNDWNFEGVQFEFREYLPSYESRSTMSISEWNPTAQEYRIPALTVGVGDVVVYDFGYQTARVTARLRVATNELLDDPYISGRYLWNLAGIWDRHGASLTGEQVGPEVQEGLVHLHLIPGVYELTARADVLGSSTTFGAPFQVTVDAGDEIILDPDAPAV